MGHQHGDTPGCQIKLCAVHGNAAAVSADGSRQGPALVGGQVNFIYGASLAPQGKAIIAMPSTTNKGGSKIAPVIIEGGGVVTTRPHVHYVVTEFGAVDLYGKSMQERAKALISIAHPDHQESLDRAAFERFGPHYTTIKL